MMGVVQREERDWRRMLAAMAREAVYIAMVDDRWMDGWRQSSRLGNRVSLMSAADRRTGGDCIV